MEKREWKNDTEREWGAQYKVRKEDMIIKDAEFTEVEDIDTKLLDEAMKSLS